MKEKRQRDADGSRREILEVATREFAAKGLAGARVDEIAAQTRTTKRMIYYHFGSKEGLYEAVIEAAYGGIRDLEQDLGLDRLAPLDALGLLVDATFDYHDAHPEFVRLVAGENINEARGMPGGGSIADRNETVLATLRALLSRGEAEGAFRPGLDALDLHLLISSFCFYRVSNRHTLGRIFGRDLRDAAMAARHRRMIRDAVLAWVRA